MAFTTGFDTYVCAGDTISCHVDGFDVTARVHYDDDTTPPDERCDGFWPSLDPKSDGWIGAKSKRTLERRTAEAREVMRSWKADEWFYCGVALTVSRNGVTLTNEFSHALWGVEANYPQQRKGAAPNAYLREVANDLLDEALAAARTILADLVKEEA